jgi:hypothetical protein
MRDDDPHEGAHLLAALTLADIELDKLRHYLRLCQYLLLTDGQYAHAAMRVRDLIAARQPATPNAPPACYGESDPCA